jgi:hypothetical protein
MSHGRSPERADERPVDGAAGAAPGNDRGPRPMIERVGLGAIALVLAVAFGAIAVAAFAGGEVFLGVMAGAGALMTLWAAAVSVLRG